MRSVTKSLAVIVFAACAAPSPSLPNADDGSGRLFVCEKAGRLRVIEGAAPGVPPPQQRYKLTLFVAVLFPVLTFVIFETWFLVPMPKGPLEAWLGY